MAASILNDSTTFLLDFEGPGPPETVKLEEKMLLENCCIFRVEQIFSRIVFFRFRVTFWCQFWRPGLLKERPIGSSFLVFFWRGPFFDLGSLFLLKTMCFARVFFRI